MIALAASTGKGMIGLTGFWYLLLFVKIASFKQWNTYKKSQPLQAGQVFRKLQTRLFYRR